MIQEPALAVPPESPQRASSVFSGAWCDYSPGRRFRVARDGAYVWGLRPVAPWIREGVRVDLQIGTIITCLGRHNTRGDGVPAVTWGDADGHAFCEDPVFSPSITDSMWDERPDPSFLDPI